MDRATAACLFALMVSGPLPHARAEKSPKSVPAYVTWRGAHSRLTERCQYRITTEKEWVDLWLRHVGHKPKGKSYDLWQNPANAPHVDFDTCMVVAIFQGSAWNRAGVVAKSVTAKADCLRFRFRDDGYQTAGPDGGGVRVTAYGMFVLPRSAKPLVLEENVQNQIGAPPVWKERHRFGPLGKAAK
jgi:hypothetical protein